MIYLVRTMDNRRLKVGYTRSEKTIKHRMFALQNGNPCRLEILFTCSGCRTLEKSIHRALIKNRTSGEWFDLTTEHVFYFVKNALKGGIHYALAVANGYNWKYIEDPKNYCDPRWPGTNIVQLFENETGGKN